jgi:hypothetical protein
MPMKRSFLLFVVLPCLGGPACHDQAQAVPDAASPAIVPMGMASAATLVPTTNAVEVLAKVHNPREAVLGNGELLVTATASDTPDPDSRMDLLSVPLAVGGTPKRLYTAQRGAEGLATAGGRLVWIVAPSDDKTEHAKILTAKGGARPTTVARTYDLDETSAVSDGTDVFTFGDVKDAKASVLSTDLLRVGANGKATRVAGAGPRPVRIVLAVNATHVFWIQDDGIVRAPKAGGDPTPVTKVAGSKIQQLAADDGAVYWADLGTGDPTWSGRVKRASLADGKVDTISDAPSPVAIAVDADTIYWASSPDAGGRILARKKTGGSTFVLAMDLRKPRSLVVDGQYVYWLDAGDGGVCRAEKTPHVKP